MTGRPGSEQAFRFNAALVRRPGRSVERGLRATDRGSPDYLQFRQEHDVYVAALQRAGLQVTVLDAIEEYPDSVFVEDTALCFPEGMLVLRPGAPSRRGEAAMIAPELEKAGRALYRNESSGFIDGGDVLVTGVDVLVGLSQRTDRAGIDWLKSILTPWGYRVRTVQTPGPVLHFKSDCCLLDEETILATHRLADAACFSGFRVLTVPRGEEAAANTLRVNETVLTPRGYARTAKLLADEGYRVEQVPVSQAALLDGGLSCMSLRFSDFLPG
jgi:dimethylargininase